MSIQISVILFFGVGLPLYAFLTGLYYLKKNQKSENNIQRIVAQVMEHPGDTDSLLQKLLMSGVLDLEDGKEIFEVCYRIEKLGGVNPVPEDCGLSRHDMKTFFTYLSENKMDVNNTPIEKLTQAYRKDHPVKKVME